MDTINVNDVIAAMATISFSDLDKLVKAGVEIRKNRRAAEKEQNKITAAAQKAASLMDGKSALEAANLSEGTEVQVIFKGAERTAKFVKMTEKRFTVEIDGAKKSIMYDKFRGLTADVVVEDEIDEDDILDDDEDVSGL